jgi:hypothetical protein
VLNVTNVQRTATLRVAFPVRDVAAVRLDETPADHPVTRSEDAIRFDVPPHGLRSLLLT